MKAKANKLIVEMAELVNEMALVRNRYLGIIKSLEIKNYQVGHIVRLRSAGLEDATL